MKAEEQSALVKKAYELVEQNKTLKAIIDKGYDINSKEMIEQITNSIYEYEYLQDVERKAKLDTIDSQLENKRMAAKIEAINKKPNIKKDVATHLTKLSQAQATNDINHAKLDLQKRIGDTELDNQLLKEQYNALTGNKQQINSTPSTNKQSKKYNNDDDEFNANDKNITDDVLESVKEMNNQQIELQKKIDENEVRKRVNDSEASLANQVDYQTTYNDTRNEMEEEKQKEETGKRKCLTWLVEQVKNQQNYNVLRHVYQTYYPYKMTYEGQEVSVQNMTSSELCKLMNDFQDRINRASNQRPFCEKS